MELLKYGTADTVYKQDLISSYHYHQTISLLRDFFLSKNFIEVPTQSRISILAACEDPTTIQTYNFLNTTWPLPQTGQMWLEYELLKNPEVPGYFCISTSYREEKNPIPGRHKTIFPMFEFEMHGGIDELKAMEKELAFFLGLVQNNAEIKEVTYLQAANTYKVQEITAEHEFKMIEDFGKVVILTDFPVYTSPFWNMAIYKKGEAEFDPNIPKAKKVDVIIEGNETIGSAERAVDKDEMKEMFYTISDGNYANLLFNKFGKERVEKELEQFLSFDFFKRCGGGIGITRLISALLKNNIIKDRL